MNPEQVANICRLETGNYLLCNSWEFWEEAAKNNLSVDRNSFYATTGYEMTSPQERYLEFASRTGAPKGAENYKALNLCLCRAASKGENVQYFLDVGANNLSEAAYQAARRNDMDSIRLINEVKGLSIGNGVIKGYAERGILFNKEFTPSMLEGASRGTSLSLVRLIMERLKKDRVIKEALISWSQAYNPDLDIGRFLMNEANFIPAEKMSYELGKTGYIEGLNLLKTYSENLDSEYRFGKIAGGIFEGKFGAFTQRESREIGRGGQWKYLEDVSDWDMFLIGASEGGHLDMINYALLTEPDIETISTARSITGYGDIAEFLGQILSPEPDADDIYHQFG